MNVKSRHSTVIVPSKSMSKAFNAAFGDKPEYEVTLYVESLGRIQDVYCLTMPNTYLYEGDKYFNELRNVAHKLDSIKLEKAELSRINSHSSTKKEVDHEVREFALAKWSGLDVPEETKQVMADEFLDKFNEVFGA